MKGLNRLRRLLALVPHASKRDGVPVDELAEVLGCTREELLSDVTVLSMVGTPPWSPDDLIDIEVMNDRVFVRLPHGFDRPPRLTAPEAAALTAASRALAPRDPLVTQALGKLERAVAPTHRELYDALIARLMPAAPASDASLLDCIDRGIKERREVEIDYLARSELRVRRRSIRPRAIVWTQGAGYVPAVNEAGEERVYRVDRMASCELTARRFDPLPPIDVQAAVARAVSLAESDELPRALVRFSPQVAAHAAVRHQDGSRQADGALMASVAYASSSWLVSYVLSWGGEAEIVEPAEARDTLRREVERALAAHSD